MRLLIGGILIFAAMFTILRRMYWQSSETGNDQPRGLMLGMINIEQVQGENEEEEGEEEEEAEEEEEEELEMVGEGNNGFEMHFEYLDGALTEAGAPVTGGVMTREMLEAIARLRGAAIAGMQIRRAREEDRRRREE